MQHTNAQRTLDRLRALHAVAIAMVSSAALAATFSPCADRSSVRFDSPIDALFVPIEVVDRPFPHRDDTIRSVLEPHIARQRRCLLMSR